MKRILVSLAKAGFHFLVLVALILTAPVWLPYQLTANAIRARRSARQMTATRHATD
ncbi:MAG TPA: hypothetical protein VG936_02335 [Lacunisphaera sp.]|nr:hypothetical protein [Lacunisphaera sp.]